MRILAFTTDASLEVALSSLDERFEIVAARDPEDAFAHACRCDLALVALGSTERGLHAAGVLGRLGVGIPCLIVGDVAAPPQPPAPAVLTRPFSLAELADAMERAARSPVAPLPRAADPPPRAADPPPRAADPPPPPGHPAAPPSAEGDVDALLRQLEDAALAAGDGDDPWKSEPTDRALLPLPRSAAPAVEATAARMVRHAAASPPTGDRLAERSAERIGLHRLRRRRRAIPLSTSPRASMMRRVRNALEGARDLVALLEEVPALAEPDAMAGALVRETVEMLGAETAALLAVRDAAAGGGFRVEASHGLSAVERSIEVREDHALLCDVARRLEAVLVAPVDLVRGLVSGVPGTHVEALIFAPLEVDGRCHGILLAGRARFADEDLERAWHLAEEAAPGFAAAQLLTRLRSQPVPTAL